MIAIHNLSKTYAGRTAVQELNLDIHRGEFFGLLGPNGAGKTTFINMLTGLISPSKGTITIDALESPSNWMAIKAKIGFVPQDFAFYPTLSARDNLLFFGRVYGLYGRRLKRQIDKSLGAVDLSKHAQDTVSTFSNGMKRRLNIAIGMLHHPQILILDEPTVGVDAHVKQLILENLLLLNQEGTTIVLTTHHMEEAQRMCHRVAVMDTGSMVALDSPSTLIEDLGGGIVRACFKDTVSDQLMEALTRLGETALVDPGTVHMVLESLGADEVIRCVRSLSEAAGVSIKRLSILEPSLEAVFLHLTGRPPVSNGGLE